MSISSESDSACMDDGKVALPYIRGRAAGACTGGGAPKFVGTLSESGRIRIDCENYPEHWQEIQLPDEVVRAWMGEKYRPEAVAPLQASETAIPPCLGRR